MKQVYEIMLVATLILTAYLVISVERNFLKIQQNIVDSQKSVAPLEKQLNDQQQLLEVLQAELTAFHNEVDTRVAIAEKLKADIAVLSDALSKVNQGQALAKQGKMDKAIEILKSVKEPIWKSGDIFVSEQATLRGLMWPIDQVMEKWKSGDKKADTSQITRTLKTVLENIKP